MKKLIAILTCAFMLTCIFAASAFAKVEKDEKTGDPVLDDILENYEVKEPTDLSKALGLVVQLDPNTEDYYQTDIYILDKGVDSFEDFADKRAALLNSKVFPIPDGVGGAGFFFPALVRYKEEALQDVTYVIDTDSPYAISVDVYREAADIPLGNSGKKMIIPIGWKEVKPDNEKMVSCYEYKREEGYEYDPFFVDKITVYEWKTKGSKYFEKTVMDFCKENGCRLDLEMINGDQILRSEKYNENGGVSVEYWFMKGGKAYSVKIDAPMGNDLAISMIAETIR